MPLVSVVMPVYNGDRFLRPAIESILTQTYQDLELVIIDDGSSDDSYQIVMSYHDPRIRIHQNRQNQGIVAALNRGITESRGEFICRMDADDIAVPSRIQRQVEQMRANELLAVLGTNALLIDESGIEVGRATYPTTAAQIRKKLFKHNPFAHGSTMIRRSVLDMHGLYNPRFLHNEDYDLWLRIASMHEVANLPEFLLKRRIHGGNITAARQTELVKYRIRTLSHALVQYYRNPLNVRWLIRPILAYLYRAFKEILAK